jgi:two-component system response regulator HydG
MEIDPSAVLPAAGTPTICVLDDDPSMLRAIDRLLSSVGLEAQLFSKPLDFLSYAGSHSVAVAVIDIWMPGMSGLQVERKLQAVSPKTRVIIITANDNDFLHDEFIRNGAIPFFVKPFNDAEFLAAVYQATTTAT